jgi:hypothetical protein
MPRIAIIGTGPIGLEAALYGRTLGHQITVFDRAEIAASVHAWQFVRLFTPWRMNTTPLGRTTLNRTFPADARPTGAELRDQYLLPLADSPLLRDALRPYHRIVTIGKADYGKSDAIGQPTRGQSAFRLLLINPAGDEQLDTADIVLDCSGTYGHHRFAGRGGIPALGERAAAPRLHYTLPDVLGVDRPQFANRRSLILGCGFSAATVLRDFAELYRTAPQTRVIWATRRSGQALHAIDSDPLPGRHELVDAAIALAQSPPSWLTILPSTQLDSIRAGETLTLHLTTNGTPRDLVVDECIPLVGYSPDASLYDQLQIHQCYATSGPIKLAAALLGATAGNDCLTAGNALTPDTLKNPEPHFYLLGAKSYGTNSNFLLQTGHQQIRDVFRLIQGDPVLDLYKM